MNKLRSLKLVTFTVVTVLIALIVVGSMTMLGGNVTEEFSIVDEGLSTGSVPDKPSGAGGAATDAVPPTNAMAKQQTRRQMIIRHATLSVEVEDVRSAETDIGTMAEEMGGYVVETNNYGVDENLKAQMTVRVPSESFDPALEHIQQLSLRIFSQQVSGEDVTAEFVDLESRLRNLEATRDRLLELLDRANDVEDALSVNTSLSQVQGEIEQVRGRMQYLQQSAALSTITVSLYGEPPAPPLVAENSWQPLAVASEALRALLTLAEALLYVVIVLLIWTPVWLPFVLLGRWLWKRNRKRQQAIPTSPTTPTSHPH